MLDPLGAILTAVLPIFEELEITYYIGGSVASGAHGEKRHTNDVDVVADVKKEHVAPLVAKLSKELYADEKMMLGAIRHGTSFNIIHMTLGYKMDIFPLKPRPYDQQVATRRQLTPLDTEPPMEVYAAQPEDIVLAKIEWYRNGGGSSDRQWNDILGVLKLQCFTLDFDYMAKWAKEIKVDDLLEKALEDAGIEETEEGKSKEPNGNSN
jgi:hypothetical protein